MRSRTAIPIAATAAAAAAAVFAGGFDPLPRAGFVALAGAALFAAYWLDSEGVRQALRSLPALALLGLAALSAASALWALAEPQEPLRWALVIAGYAAMLSAAMVIAGRPHGIEALVAIVCGLAVAAALTGLIAVAVREDPLALRLGRVWRPAGPFEYPPALALLQVSALPGLLWAMLSGGSRLAPMGAAGASVAAGVTALADSRLALALAIAAALAAAWGIGRVRPKQQLALAAAVALIGLSAIAALLALGGTARGDETGGDAARLLFVVALPGAAAAAWGLGGGWIQRRQMSEGGSRGTILLTAAAALAALVVLGSALSEPVRGRGAAPVSGIDHGRSETWDAALQAGWERPLGGAGAESFFLATAGDLGGLASLYAHSLPLEAFAELGILGLALVLLLYGASAAWIWRAREHEAAWLLGPAAAAFLVANLFDWPWHLAGSGAVWAIALGGVIGSVGARQGGVRRTAIKDQG